MSTPADGDGDRVMLRILAAELLMALLFVAMCIGLAALVIWLFGMN